MEVLIKGKITLNRLVGIGSKIQVDGTEETVDFSWTDRLDKKSLNTNHVLKIVLNLL